MVTIDLKLNEHLEKVNIKDEILFNAVLCENPKLIKKIIKSIYPLYRISKAFFEIVNTFVDFTNDGDSLYIGLVVRTSLEDYAVLYLEDTQVNEELLIKVIEDYIHDKGDHQPREININKFEIKHKVFLTVIHNI